MKGKMQNGPLSMARHYGILAIKLICVPAGLIWLSGKLLADPRVGALRIEPWLLVAAVVINQLALTLFAFRMRAVLKIFNIPMSFFQAIRIHLQSVFYFFVLPMTVGLEAARFAKIKKAAAGTDVQSKTLAAALLVDRLVGAVAAMLIAVSLYPFVELKIPDNWKLTSTPFWLLVIVAVVAAVVFLGIRFRGRVREISSGWKKNRVSLSNAFAISMITHLLFCTAIFLAAVAIGIPIDLLHTVFVVSAAMLFVVFPISFAGAGPIELANVGMLLALGITLQQAVAFSLLSYVARLVAAFEGGAWEIWEGGLLAFARSR